MYLKRFTFFAVFLLILPRITHATTTVTFTRSEIAEMAGLWETDAVQFSPLANAQYPSIGGGTSVWQYTFASTGISADGDNHIAAGFTAKFRAFVGRCNVGLTVHRPSNGFAEGDGRGPGSGDNEDAPSETRNDFRQLPDFALSEVNLLWNTKRERHHEYGSGTTLVNFSLIRGVTSRPSISARHFAKCAVA